MVFKESFKLESRHRAVSFHDITDQVKAIAKKSGIRDGIVVYEGELGSLRIGKDNVSEVAAGKECGMSIAGYNDIKEGDMIEAYKIVEIKRTL